MTDFLKKLAIVNDKLLMLDVMKFTDIFSMDAQGAETFCDVQKTSHVQILWNNQSCWMRCFQKKKQSYLLTR